MKALQNLILAQLDCIAAGDRDGLQHFRGRAIGLTHRLGLHQCQARFALTVLARETRKKVFWCQYTLDW